MGHERHEAGHRGSSRPLRAKRAAVSARFLDEADRLLDKLRAPCVVHAFGGKDNEFNAATLAEPDAGADPL